MPAISPQGSRTGLVTALVIFVILFVTTTILYIYENAERRNLQERASDLEKRQAELVNEAVMSSPEVTALLESARNANSTALETVLSQRKEMAKAITGQEMAPDGVKQQVQNAIATATAPGVAAANTPISRTSPLTLIVSSLANRVTQLQGELVKAQQDVATAKAETQAAIAAREKMLAEKDRQLAEVQAKIGQELTELASYRSGVGVRVRGIEETTTQALNQAQEANAQLNAQVTTANTTIAKLQQQLDEVTRRLKGIRIGTNEPTVQKHDGKIARVPDNDTVVIDLGVGDQIVQGMTFEVYDWQSGVPALGDGMRAGDMPQGKASIEVIEMGPGFSRCRVIRRTPGYGIVVGDVIANLIYDPSQKYNFVVYGDFDLDNNGQASPGDADVIKRLVTQWGGKVTNEVNINTDFVVMGVEPTAEPITNDEDPIVRQQKLEAQAALDRYLATRKAAEQLNIPILNQNRFLNFVGYRNQATR